MIECGVPNRKSSLIANSALHPVFNLRGQVSGG